MKPKPIINMDDPVGKTVGRRKAPDSLDLAFGLQKTLNQFRKFRYPRGVYRFRSHEEADEWMMKYLTQGS